MTDIPIIDPVAIQNLRELGSDGGNDFLVEIVGIFREDTPQRISELRDSLAGGEVDRFIRAAHSIKGSSSNIGAMRLSHAAATLEIHAKVKGLGGSEPLIEDVQGEFDQACETLMRLAGS